MQSLVFQNRNDPLKFLWNDAYTMSRGADLKFNDQKK